LICDRHSGVPTNLHGEVVTERGGDPEAIVPGLMAIGEAACVSVHGANRLGSNALLDIIVFGRAAALRVTESLRGGEGHPPLSNDATDRAIARLDRIRWAKSQSGAGTIRLAMQQTMQRHCAVFRTGSSLEEGADKLDGVIATMKDLAVADRSMMFNTDLTEALELDNMLAQGNRQPALGHRSHRKPRCSRARGFSKARRRGMAQAHAVMARRRWSRAPRLSASPFAAALE
jgi:succinate dehydrogenase / fumarate reductase flavoprotein subunit